MSATPHFEGVSHRWQREVLQKSLEQIRQRCQDTFEDAVLMGCDENQLRGVMADLITKLESPYTDGQRRVMRAALSL